MAGTEPQTISQLSSQPNSLDGSEYVPIVQTVSGIPRTYKTTISQISGSGNNIVSSLNSENGHIVLTSAGGTVTITTPSSHVINLESSGGGGGTPGGTNGQVQYNNSGSFGGFTVGGDGTLDTSTGSIIITKTNGVAFAASATTNATNAANISSGTLPAARLPNPTSGTLGGVQSAGAVSHQFIDSISTLGVPHLSQPVAGDISGLGTIATQNANNVAISGGTIDGTVIGNSSQVAGSFSALNATSLTISSGTTNILSANTSINIQTLVSGAVSISSADVGTIDNMDIGDSIPAAGNFTTISSVSNAILGSATISNLNSAGVVTTNSSGNLATNTRLPAGQFPALTGDVTTSAGSLSTAVSKIAGTVVSATTGTTNVVFSASPTLTGTIVASSVTLSGNLYLNGGTAWSSVFSNGNSGTSKAISLDNGNLQSVSITGAVAITQTTPTHPGKYTLIATQDATGHVYSLSGIKWSNGVTPTYSTTASAIDIFSIIYDGTNYYGMGGIGFA